MSDQNFVYGVFKDNIKALDVVAQLHTSGFSTSQIGVLGAKDQEFKYISGKVEDPSAKNFVRFGIAGCIGGLWAGISSLRVIPDVVPFQILTPLMAAISGGAVLAYFGSFMGVYLNSDKPQHWANVFEGTVEEGSVIVLAECGSRDQMRSAMGIMDQEDPLELIVRQKSLPWAIKSEPAEKPATTERTTPTLSAVA